MTLALGGFVMPWPPVSLQTAHADQADEEGASVRAAFERDAVALDESAALSITVVSNGFGGPEGEPRFKAPDFDVLRSVVMMVRQSSLSRNSIYGK